MDSGVRFCVGIVAVAASSSAAFAQERNRPLLATEFPARVLAAHNVARVQAGAAQLSWDPVLAEGAAQHAVYMARTGDFNHSDRRTRPGIGENLWSGTHGAYSIETAVGGWAAERRKFQPGIFPNNSSTGNWLDISHYTQMIWPTTTRVGCALASNMRTDYLVCRYSPKGNIDGRNIGN